MAALDIKVEDDEEVKTDNNFDEDFNVLYYLAEEKAVTTCNTYILHMSGTVYEPSRIAVALSDCTSRIYDLTHLTEIEKLKGHTAGVTGIKFSPESSHLVFSSSLDGSIKLWDLRDNKKYIKEFKDDSEGKNVLKPLLDFDITCNSNFLCGGTELLEEDAFLLFWDVRSSDLLGGYWESHTDDITQVHFHPSKQDTLISGSMDGLINFFDISKQDEDEALLHTLNTESSVQKLGWINEENKDSLFCITHTEELQWWNIDGAAPFKNFSRESISTALKLKTCNDCYIAGIHQTKNPGELMVIGGSNVKRRKCLHVASFKENEINLWTQLMENKQIVRCSLFDKNNESFITGGERGFLSLWKTGKTEQAESANLKMRKKHYSTSNQSKPY